MSKIFRVFFPLSNPRSRRPCTPTLPRAWSRRMGFGLAGWAGRGSVGRYGRAGRAGRAGPRAAQTELAAAGRGRPRQTTAAPAGTPNRTAFREQGERAVRPAYSFGGPSAPSVSQRIALVATPARSVTSGPAVSPPRWPSSTLPLQTALARPVGQEQLPQRAVTAKGPAWGSGQGQPGLVVYSPAARPGQTWPSRGTGWGTRGPTPYPTSDVDTDLLNVDAWRSARGWGVSSGGLRERLPARPGVFETR